MSPRPKHGTYTWALKQAEAGALGYDRRHHRASSCGHCNAELVEALIVEHARKEAAAICGRYEPTPITEAQRQRRDRLIVQDVPP